MRTFRSFFKAEDFAIRNHDDLSVGPPLTILVQQKSLVEQNLFCSTKNLEQTKMEQNKLLFVLLFAILLNKNCFVQEMLNKTK